MDGLEATWRIELRDAAENAESWVKDRKMQGWQPQGPRRCLLLHEIFLEMKEVAPEQHW